MDILENQELRMANVLSFRKPIPAAGLQAETERIGRFVDVYIGVNPNIL